MNDGQYKSHKEDTIINGDLVKIIIQHVFQQSSNIWRCSVIAINEISNIEFNIRYS